MTLITPGQAGDSPMFLPLMAQLRVGRDRGRPRTRPDAVRGDKAYSSRAIRGHLRARGIKAVIPEPEDQKPRLDARYPLSRSKRQHREQRRAPSAKMPANVEPVS